jgi:hypothetical protein
MLGEAANGRGQAQSRYRDGAARPVNPGGQRVLVPRAEDQPYTATSLLLAGRYA